MSQKSFLLASAVFSVTSVLAGASTNPDERIEAAAKNSYVFQTYLKNDTVNVESKNGVVTLTGHVSEAAHQTLAEKTVESISGVKKVVNHLQFPEKRQSIGSDAWIRTQIQTALLFRRDVKASSTDVEVKGGTVTLRGPAVDQIQKDRTTAYARDVDGVQDVNNQMTGGDSSHTTDGSLAQNIDDASVTAQVKMVLLTHRSTSSLDTKVQTKDGLVTLRGIARTAAEKDLASKYASSVDGVRDVNNNMRVANAS